MSYEYDRPLTEFEEKILKYIEDNPGMTADYIGNSFEDTKEAYDAVGYLVAHLYVEVDYRTFALTARPR